MNFITYAQYSSAYLVLIGYKVPVFDVDKKKVIAVALNYMDISKTNLALSCFHLYLGLTKSGYNVKNTSQFTVRLDTQSPLYDKLTAREAECLFYLVHGHTAKETAQRLGISFRTVECYIDTLKQKFQCDKKSTLVEKAISLGYLNFLPMDIIQSNL